MKKHKVFLCSILLITILLGCQSKNLKTSKIKDTSLKKIVEPKVEEKIPLGLYQNNNGTKILTPTYNSPLTIYKDIISLEVFYTTNPILTGNQIELWNKYEEEQGKINHKIGYVIEYQIENRKVNQIITSPSDTEKIFNDIQVYLYDDINQTTKTYSHVTQKSYHDNTILTSIKLTASTNINKITSPITVTAFVYEKDNLSKKRGKYQTIIQRKI